MRFYFIRGLFLSLIVLLASVEASWSVAQEAPSEEATTLVQAIRQGMQPGQNLSEQLEKVYDKTVSTREQARAIIDALRKLPRADENKSDEHASDIDELNELFHEVEDTGSPAFELLESEGTTELVRIFDKLKKSDDEEVLASALSVAMTLASYETRAGTEKVIEAARQPILPDHYLWSAILECYEPQHLQFDFFLGSVSDPVPHEGIGLQILDLTNSQLESGYEFHHPFDSAAGRKQLLAWLTDVNAENIERTLSAAKALPYISGADELLLQAAKHPNMDVQLAGAYAAAKLEKQEGFDTLARLCLDLKCSIRAAEYLEQLERFDLIPAEAKEPDFHAKAEFVNWLVATEELQNSPYELEIVDKRELRWPPERLKVPMWLIQYRIKDTTGLEEDEVGIGAVGAVTFAPSFYELTRRPYEDIYALNCFWQMEILGLIESITLDDETESEYKPMLEQWKGEPLEDPKVIQVAKMDSQLKYGQSVISFPRPKTVALASATLAGVTGWVVLDGDRSKWYPAPDFPQLFAEESVLMVHVGRRLLGFTGSPDRANAMAEKPPDRTPEQIVEAYEKLLLELEGDNEARRLELLGEGLLATHFEKYTAAAAKVKSIPEDEAVIETYEKFLAAAARPTSDPSAAYNFSGPIFQNFERYVDALVATDPQKVKPLLDLLDPHCELDEHGMLARAAMKIEDFETAERHFQKLRASLDDVELNEDMSVLADVLVKRGKPDEAKMLLIECLTELVADSKTPDEWSQEELELPFNTHRETYLRLFPGSEAELQEKGIPEKLVVPEE